MAEHATYKTFGQWLRLRRAGWDVIKAKLTAYEQALIVASLQACAAHLKLAALQAILQQAAEDWTAQRFL
jgi:hypothetical protein